MIYVGIDPGVNTGFAIWDSRLGKFNEIATLDFLSVIVRVKDLNRVTDLTVYIEDPGQVKPMFWQNKRGVNESMIKQALKVAQNVGANKREAELLIQILRDSDMNVIPVKPVTSKMNAETFANITGYKQRTSEHGRDAAMLVFGRK